MTYKIVNLNEEVIQRFNIPLPLGRIEKIARDEEENTTLVSMESHWSVMPDQDCVLLWEGKPIRLMFCHAQNNTAQHVLSWTVPDFISDNTIEQVTQSMISGVNCVFDKQLVTTDNKPKNLVVKITNPRIPPTLDQLINLVNLVGHRIDHELFVRQKRKFKLIDLFRQPYFELTSEFKNELIQSIDVFLEHPESKSLLLIHLDTTGGAGLDPNAKRVLGWWKEKQNI
jgi:hypothetical protein